MNYSKNCTKYHVYLAIGSNIEPQENILRAIQEIQQSVKIIKVSNFYWSAALKRENDPRFLNGALVIKTNIPPRVLKFDILRSIEDKLGRVRTSDAYAPRTIDLDIALYGDIVMQEPGLILPDPDIPNRHFLAVPLFELSPHLVMPDTQIPIAEIVYQMDTSSIVLDEAFSRKVRELTNYEH